jgi:hypothetical protein
VNNPANRKIGLVFFSIAALLAFHILSMASTRRRASQSLPLIRIHLRVSAFSHAILTLRETKSSGSSRVHATSFTPPTLGMRKTPMGTLSLYA